MHEVTFVIGNLIVIDKSDQEVLRTEAFRDRSTNGLMHNISENYNGYL